MTWESLAHWQRFVVVVLGIPMGFVALLCLVGLIEDGTQGWWARHPTLDRIGMVVTWTLWLAGFLAWAWSTTS
jgi:hypothetical protein